MRKPVAFLNKGQTLIGVLHVPAEAESNGRRYPGVILCHGFTGTKVEPHRIFVKTAEKLAAQGIVAFRFDFRGSGDSEGEFYEATVSGEISDAQVALGYMASLPFVDEERLGAIGLSMGGAVVACLAGRERKVKSAVLWSAVADFGQLPIFAQDFSDQLKTIRTPTGETKVHDRNGSLVSPTLAEDAMQLRPSAELVVSDSSVLIVHGDQDQTVPVAHADIFEKALAGTDRDVRKHIVAEADHTYNRYEWEQETISVTVDWLKNHLR